MERIRVYVNHSHIVSAKKAGCVRSPIEIALREMFPGRSFDVETTYVVFYRNGRKEYRAVLPYEAQQFERSCEAGSDVHPFWFHMKVPYKV